MKLFSTSLLLFMLSVPLFAAEIVKFQLFDGETVEGKLSLPANIAPIKELVIYIHGTGPATYLNRRKFGALEFSYFDTFAEEFNRRGIAFFTYNKRGVTVGDQPPLFETIDREKFKKVVPSVEIKDIATFIGTLRKDKRLAKAKIVLLGWSEGTVVAALAAENKKNDISALLLAGYVNDNMYDVIKWQNSGESSMVILRKSFDANHDKTISKAEYQSEEKAPAYYRTKVLAGAKFEQLDVSKDSAINTDDFGMFLKERYKAILDAYERKDDTWIWDHYFHVTTAWLGEHFALDANKSRLLRFKIPIYIFHGEDDANCPVEGVYDIRDRFARANKKNLSVFTFKDHNHDLNFVDWIEKKQISPGIKKIFEITDALNR